MKVKLVIIVLKLLQSEAIVTCANRINNVPQGSLCCIYLDFSGMNHKHIIFLYQMDDVQENCSFQLQLNNSPPSPFLPFLLFMHLILSSFKLLYSLWYFILVESIPISVWDQSQSFHNCLLGLVPVLSWASTLNGLQYIFPQQNGGKMKRGNKKLAS